MLLKMLFIFFLGGRLDKSSNNHLTRVQEALFYNCINILSESNRKSLKLIIVSLAFLFQNVRCISSEI